MENNIYSVIVRPLITEKGTHLSEARNAYSFEVAKNANKTQIRQAIEKIYGVKVADVRTANRKGKTRRRGRGTVTTKSWKKAVVLLQPEHRIDLF